MFSGCNELFRRFPLFYAVYMNLLMQVVGDGMSLVMFSCLFSVLIAKLVTLSCDVSSRVICGVQMNQVKNETSRIFK